VGQEAGLYDQLGLRVIWVEPDPEVFRGLKTNISRHSRQEAYMYLLSDRDDASVEFHIANNAGLSSSILDLKLHSEIWPQVKFDRSIRLLTCTLDTMIQRERIRSSKFQALVLDTQGSELLILKGAETLIKGMTFIKVEVADFESYEGCCQLADVEAFLMERGFREYHREIFAERMGGGTYYDVVYKRRSSKR
jgi:FkbM family methyltransferase